MDIYEEMLLQIVDVLKKHNRPLPDLTHKEAIEEIRSIILGNTTHAEKVSPDDIKKLDNTDSKDYYSLDELPREYILKLKNNPHKCGDCRYLIFKDYKHHSGTCTINRLERSFSDICTHEEDKM